MASGPPRSFEAHRGADQLGSAAAPVPARRPLYGVVLLRSFQKKATRQGQSHESKHTAVGLVLMRFGFSPIPARAKCCGSIAPKVSLPNWLA